MPSNATLSISQPGAPVDTSVPRRKRTWTSSPASAVPKSMDTAVIAGKPSFCAT